jgi:hypothetical protein
MKRQQLYNRTLPYLNLLIEAPNERRQRSLVKGFPKYVIDDIAEIILNILKGNAKLTPSQLKRVLQQRTKLLNLYKIIRQKKKRSEFIYKQGGGFLPMLLPILASIASGLLL